jgi:glutaredoxin
MMAKEILLYSAKLCGDCQSLKAFMDANGIDYELRDIHADEAHAAELKQQTGRLGVPYLRIDGAWIRGYDAGKPFSDEFARGLFTR